MTLLVCGGRHYSDRARVAEVLDTLQPKAIVHGDAHGADTLAGEYARNNLIEVRAYPANWSKYGRAAGPIRNQQMIDSEPVDMVVAFPGGRGTAHMVQTARTHGIHVEIIPKENA